MIDRVDHHIKLMRLIDWTEQLKLRLLGEESLYPMYDELRVDVEQALTHHSDLRLSNR